MSASSSLKKKEKEKGQLTQNTCVKSRQILKEIFKYPMCGSHLQTFAPKILYIFSRNSNLPTGNHDLRQVGMQFGLLIWLRVGPFNRSCSQTL